MADALLSGVLPYVYSQGDRAKRYLADMLRDPVGSMAQTAGNLADKDRDQRALMAKALANPQRPLEVTDPQALGQATDNMMTGLMGFAPAGITVWHGSPHTFDAFDASKIGTGEGMQAYGHGIYSAESPEVAKSYQQALAGQNGASIVQNGRNSYSVVAPDGSKLADGVLLGQAHKAKDGFDAAQTGSLYKVDLPDSAVAKMLDWDKPLSQQAPEVLAAIPPAKDYALLRKQYANIQDKMEGLPVYSEQFTKMHDKLTQLSRQMEYSQKLSKATGGDIYDILGAGVGNQITASEKLQQAGIPGIRYLDGGSRGAGQGSSNFVVFPGQESLLQILERNGAPIK